MLGADEVDVTYFVISAIYFSRLSATSSQSIQLIMLRYPVDNSGSKVLTPDCRGLICWYIFGIFYQAALGQ